MHDPDCPRVLPAGRPWAAMGQDGETEDWLEGNREGLLVLRTAIDHALDNGKCPIDEALVELAGVRHREEPLLFDGGPLSAKARLAVSGCVVLGLLIVSVFIVGLIQIIHFVAGFKP